MPHKPGPVLEGFIKGLILILFLSLLAGLSLYLTPLSESYLPIIGITIFIFSVFIGGWLAARQAKSQGLFTGFKVALLFITFSLLVTVTLFPGHFSWSAFSVKLLPALIAGGIGGVLGVSSAS